MREERMGERGGRECERMRMQNVPKEREKER